LNSHAIFKNLQLSMSKCGVSTGMPGQTPQSELLSSPFISVGFTSAAILDTA